MVIRHTSSSASVVKQAQTQKRVVDFDSAANKPRSGLQHGLDPQTGRPTLVALYPLPGQGSQELCLSFLLNFPNLMQMLSAGFDRWARTDKSAITRETLRNELKSGLLTYLVASDATAIGPGGLTKTFFHGFKDWLDRPAISGNAAVLHPTTRARYFTTVSRLANALLTLPEWEGVGAQILTNLPINPWSGRHLKANPTIRLDREHLASIVDAASEEFQLLSDRWEQNKRRLALSKFENTHFDDTAERELVSVLSAISSSYPAVIPLPHEIRLQDPALGRAISLYKYKNVVSHFYPSPRDLIPLIVLLAAATAFNSSTLLRLNWEGIEFAQRLGAPTVRISGPKLRSSVDQSVLLDASDGDHMNITKL